MKKQSFINIKKFQKVLSIFLILLFLNPIYAKVLAQPTVLQEGKDIIKSNYVNTVSDYVLNAPDLTEMVKRLNDPYSDYFTKKEYAEFVDSINNTFSGIGIGIDLVPEGIRISRVIENSPALGAGLVVGDLIVQVDNNSLVGISSTEEAIKFIKGVVGTYVKIVVKRGTEVLNFNIQRREIKSPTVSSEMLAGKAAYISILSFGEDTGALFSQALEKMDDLGANSYIIDLRYNGGGYLGTALDIAGHFIGNVPGIIIEDKLGEKIKYLAEDHGKIMDKPIIFLINEYSASASEILAAAVKDYDKATFIGTTTYGKGVAQQLFPLSDGSYLKLTVEKFYSPYGNIIHKRGVSPDFEVAADGVDSLKVANLLLSSTSVPKDKSGYMRIDLDGKEFYINLKMARSDEYWTEFNYILSKNSSYNAYRGSNVGWQKITSEELSNKIYQGFSNYKILTDLKKDINVDKHFTINFNMPIDYDSIKSQGIELMEESTGKRIPIKLDVDNKSVIVTPNEQLKKGQTYYLIVNDSILDAKGKSIKQGVVIKYIVP
ncbi:Ig-like domain-containing protein [Clostridium estertheticum]|uniref:S41 family peptidase n=1 Tax=Clostridium estertheticum TaxID=238834 RepID=UPI0013E90B12|nr:S41 family peptidase [Clostridium estertheticum]MBZ9688666.1 Ig-like domain-containing protein [Clostridium estertheticum]